MPGWFCWYYFVINRTVVLAWQYKPLLRMLLIQKVEMIMILYHAGKEVVEFPEIRKTKYTKDFSWGFYCTNNYVQALRWANRGEGEPTVNYYTYEENDNLSILKFDCMTDEWIDFIARCRSGETHMYDIVEGPMANDTVWNYVNDFISGRITRKHVLFPKFI